MNRTLQIVLQTMLVCSATLHFSVASAVEVGDKAPDFQLPGQGTTVKLSEPARKLVYLDFWASWCGPCRQSFPWMNEIQAKYGPDGFQIIAVNLDSKSEDAQKFLAKLPASFTLAFDPKGDTPRQYGVKGMPSSFLIARDGTILARHTGFREEDRAVLEQKIEAALKATK